MQQRVWLLEGLASSAEARGHRDAAAIFTQYAVEAEQRRALLVDTLGAILAGRGAEGR